MSRPFVLPGHPDLHFEPAPITCLVIDKTTDLPSQLLGWWCTPDGRGLFAVIAASVLRQTAQVELIPPTTLPHRSRL